jgi:hypothetical protein
VIFSSIKDFFEENLNHSDCSLRYVDEFTRLNDTVLNSIATFYILKRMTPPYFFVQFQRGPRVLGPGMDSPGRSGHFHILGLCSGEVLTLLEANQCFSILKSMKDAIIDLIYV